MARAHDYDPHGEHHGGTPRPGGQPIAAQIICRRGATVGYLYRVDLALPVRTPTLAQEEALDHAMAARQTCPACRVRYYYCLPLRTLGSCWRCWTRDERRRRRTALCARVVAGPDRRRRSQRRLRRLTPTPNAARRPEPQRAER